MPSDESKGSQLDAIGSLAQRQLDNTVRGAARKGGPYREGNLILGLGSSTSNRRSSGLRISGDVPAAVEFGRVAAAPVNTLRQQPHRCQEISVCF